MIGLLLILDSFEAIAQTDDNEFIKFLNKTEIRPCRYSINFDSIISILEKKKSPATLARVKVIQSKKASCNSEFRQSIQLLLEAINDYEDLRLNDVSHINAIFLTSISYKKLGVLDSSKYYIRKSLKKAENIKDSLLICRTYAELCGIYMEDHLNDSALYYGLKALEIAENRKDIPFRSLLMINIGAIYANVEDFDKALNYYRLGEKALLGVRDTLNLVVTYYNMANAFLSIGESDSALAQYQIGIELAEKHQPVAYMQPYLYYGLSNEYFKKSDYLKSIQYGQFAIRVGEKLEVSNSLVMIFKNLSESYLQLQDYDSSIHYGLKAVDLATIVKNEDIHSESLKILSNAYKLKKDYKVAYEYLEKHLMMEKSISSENVSKRFAELQTQYETEKKDQEIASLTQQATIQELRLSQRNNQLFIGGLFFIFVVVGGLFYYRQEKMKKEREATELEQRFLRSQLNPHFIFNSMTSIQKYMLDQDAENAAHYMGTFSTLMRQILENSREAYIPLSEEINMMENYLELQKARFNKRFEYEIIIDEKLDESYAGIPPMFAQPFIENALEHGLFHKEENKITIRFLKTSENIISLEVIDSGIGIKQEIRNQSHKSLAMQITKERLHLLSKGTHKQLDLISENITGSDGTVHGFKISLTLPTKLMVA